MSMGDDDPKDVSTKGMSEGMKEKLALPCKPLPTLAPAVQAEIEAAAAEANDRYIVEFLEEHAFCPFSRGGRAQGQTVRYVHYASDTSIAPLVEYMAAAAKNPKWMVVQVILPMIEVDPEEWIQFCNHLTAVANASLDAGGDVYAAAAMHPALRFQRSSPGALIPLFRRSPDPTIQWVRLDDLEALYAGRSGKTKVVDLDDPQWLLEAEEQEPLYERIAEANMKMVDQLGQSEVEEALAEFTSSLKKRYRDILAAADR
jgi:hypothetical protein